MGRKVNFHTEIVDPQVMPVMSWANKWISGTYKRGDVVKDGDWTMIANKETYDRAAPQPHGDPFYSYTGTISDFTTANSISYLAIGNQYTFTESGWIVGIKVYISTYIGYEYRVALVDVTDPANPVVNLGKKVTFTKTGWIYVDIEDIIVLKDTVLNVYLIIENHSDPSTDTTLNYDYNTPTMDGAPSSGEILHSNRDSNLLNVHKTDHDGTDQSSYLATLKPGDLITIGNIEWEILSSTDNGTYHTFEIKPDVQYSTDGVTSVKFTVFTDNTIDYGKDETYWSGNASISGIYEENGYLNPTVNDDAGPIDILLQRAYVSPDWDVVSLSGGTVGSTSSGSSDTYIFKDSVQAVSGEVNLVGDTASPGNLKVYSTDSGGNRGWFDFPQHVDGTGTLDKIAIWSDSDSLKSINGLYVEFPNDPDDWKFTMANASGGYRITNRLDYTDSRVALEMTAAESFYIRVTNVLDISSFASSGGITIGSDGTTTIVGDFYITSLDSATTSKVLYYDDATGKITQGNLSGGVGGSGTADQVAYWDSSSTITGNANLTFDGTDLTLGSSSKIYGRFFYRPGDTTSIRFENQEEPVIHMYVNNSSSWSFELWDNHLNLPNGVHLSVGGDAYVYGDTSMGALTPAAKLHVQDPDWPVTIIERVSSTTAAIGGSLLVKHTSTGDMADGFGAALYFGAEDDADTNNLQATVSSYRDGADDSGGLALSVYNGGSRKEFYKANHHGNAAYNGDTRVNTKLTVYAEDNSTSTAYVGIVGINSVSTGSGNMQRGVIGSVSGSGEDHYIGVWGTTGVTANESAIRAGVVGYTKGYSSSGRAYGVAGYIGGGSGNRAAVYGTDGYIDSATAPDSTYAGFFDGNFKITGGHIYFSGLNSQTTSNVLYWDSSTGEVTYGAKLFNQSDIQGLVDELDDIKSRLTALETA